MRIDLLGTSFTIQSDEDPAYLRNLVGYYRDKITEVQQSVTTSDDLKVAILGALTVVDELFRERHKEPESGIHEDDENSAENSRWAQKPETSDGSDHANNSRPPEDKKPSQDEIETIAHRLIERLDATLESGS